MQTVNQWLDLHKQDPNKFAVEIAKVLVPKPKHKIRTMWAGDPPMKDPPKRCTKCNETNPTGDCPVPDPIILDRNTAHEITRNDTGVFDALADMHEEWLTTEESYDLSLAAWLFYECQPQHYLIAAATAKES